MGKFFSLLLTFIFLTELAFSINTITVNGKAIWLNGINLPWIRWEDFDDPWGSNNYDHTKFEEAFKKYQENGINAVRVWIHCKGEGSPVLDENGKVIGPSDVFWDNFDDMMSLANKYNLLIMPAFFSFDILKSERAITKYPNNTETNFMKFISSEENVQSYIDNFLKEFINRYDTNKALLCYEICNEPEWMSDNLGANVDDFIRMHAQIAAAIHKLGTKPVTTGSASLKWTGQQYDYWSDEALQARYNDPDAYFDIFQIHYYDWMDPDGTDPWHFSPFKLTVDQLNQDVIKGRPVMVGEFPGDGGQYYTITEAYEKLLENGYIGAFAWSDFANDGHGTFDQIKEGTNYIAQKYPEYVLGTTQNIITKNKEIYLNVFPNPFNPTTNISLTLPYKSNILISVYDINGNLVFQKTFKDKNKLDYTLNFSQYNNGIYFLKVKTQNNIQTKKLIYIK